MKCASHFFCIAALLIAGGAGVSQADPLLPARTSLAADFDEDGQVNLSDFFLLAGAFGARLGEAGYEGRYDLNRDGRVDLGDFFSFSDSFGKVSPQRPLRPTVRLRDVLKTISGPRFAKVRVQNHGGADEDGASNVSLIPQDIEERVDRTPGGMEAPMVKVPAGDFIMGSNAKELGLREDFPGDESPIHVVYLSAFWIDKYEVTNAQYREFMEATGHPKPIYMDEPDFGGDRQPVVGVTWNDAVAYCKWRGMYLPTEAQWEKTARGVDGRKYPWGNEFPDEDENGIGGIENLRANFNSRHYKTFDVGSFPKGVSPYGAWDMAGNVWEWCADYYERDYYKVSPPENPRGPVLGITRVVRGGAAHGDYDDVRAPYRGDVHPEERNELVVDYVNAFKKAMASENPENPEAVQFQYRYFIGFRCVK
jgi:iron(II)-dependent oxidoreductase